MFKLRSYQQRAVDLALSCLDQAESACPVVLAACGAGKSLIGSAIADALISRSRSAGRVLVVTHRAELVRQNHDKLPARLRGSFFSASIGRKDSTGDVIFANIQSIQKQWHKLPKLQAILIDECHVAGKMYAEFIDNVKKVSPHVRVIGLTATNFDGRGVWLHMLEKHRIFTGVSSEVGIGELLVAGHLCPLTAYSGATRLDVTGVSIDARTGDFQQNQLQAAVDVPELVAQCAAEIKAIFAARNSVLVFCSGVEHAKHVAAALGGEVVLGNTPKLERARLIETFRAGRLKYLCSVDVLTTGFDSQNVDGIANLRPSRSPLVWLQLCGRGMRLHPGKDDCIATGQRVLTNHGLVPIERVTLDMQVWDGVEFVTHDGVIYKGEQEVIEYAGIIGTPDHKVWTKGGWQTLWECRAKQTPVAVTGDEGCCVKQSDGHYRGGVTQEGAPVFGDKVQRMWKIIHQSVINLAQSIGRLRSLRKSGNVPARHAEMVVGSGKCSFGEVSQSEQLSLPLLRWPWCAISFFRAGRNGGVGAGKSWLAPGVAVESDPQQRPLRAGELGVLHSENQYQQQPIIPRNREHAQVQVGTPGNQVCGRHSGWFDTSRAQRQGDCREVSQEIVQTKRGVWDIRNAGPRHRFTCEGVLVSNCLVADFTDNTDFFGPIDEIEGRPPKTKTGDAPTKVCDPGCFSIILAGLRKCPHCGMEFEFQSHEQQFDPETGLLISGVVKNEDGTKTYPVSDVTYEVRNTRAGSEALVAYYHTPGRKTPVAETWMNMWHHKRSVAARDMELWLRRSLTPGVPSNAQEALARAELGGMKVPKSVTVRPGSPFPVRFGL